MRRFLHIVFPLIFFLPLLVLVWKLPGESLQFQSFQWHWLTALKDAFMQAALSAVCAIIYGVITALGLLSLRHKNNQRVFRFFSLAPVFLPQILLVSAFLFFSDATGGAGEGLAAIVLAHSLLNGGACGVIFENWIRNQLSGEIYAARALGAGDYKILQKVILPLLWPLIFSLFAMVLGLCLMSFTIPLLMAPGEVWSLEVLIFRLIRVDFDLINAFVISLLQSLVMLGFVFFATPKTELLRSPTTLNLRFGSQIFLLGPILVCLVLGFGFFYEFSEILFEANQQSAFYREWFKAAFATAQITTLALVLEAVFLIGLLYAQPKQRLHKFLLSFLPLSPVVLGFSLWLLGGNIGFVSHLKVALGLSILFTPVLYKWQLGVHLEGLRGQIQVAKTMGATDLAVFSEVIWPQSFTLFFRLLMLFSFWAAGDFVMVSVLNFGGSSLSLMVETLLTSYRLGLASLVSISILGVGAVFVLGLAVVEWGVKKTQRRQNVFD